MCQGARAAQHGARQLASAPESIHIFIPTCADQTILAREAVGHAECRIVNHGEAKVASGGISAALPVLVTLEREYNFEFQPRLGFVGERTADVKVLTTSVDSHPLNMQLPGKATVQQSLHHRSTWAVVAILDSTTCITTWLDAGVVLTHAGATFDVDEASDLAAVVARLLRDPRGLLKWDFCWELGCSKAEFAATRGHTSVAS